MATRKQPSNGGKPDKIIRDAIAIALKREAQDADGKKTRKVTLLAQKLVDKACEGDVMAIKEVADRMDGKPTQAVDVAADVTLREVKRSVFRRHSDG